MSKTTRNEDLPPLHFAVPDYATYELARSLDDYVSAMRSLGALMAHASNDYADDLEDALERGALPAVPSVAKNLQQYQEFRACALLLARILRGLPDLPENFVDRIITRPAGQKLDLEVAR